MRSIAPWKLALILVSVIFCIYMLWPTVRAATMSPAERAAMSPADREKLEARAMKLGLDLRGGMTLLLEVDKTGLSEDEAHDAVDRALEIIRNRIDQFGVSEPSIQRQGSDRILVQLPGLQDPERAKRLIGQTALLEFKLVEPGLQGLMSTLDLRVPASLRMQPGDTTRAPGEAENSLATLVQFMGGAQDESGIVMEDDVPLVEKMLAAPEVQAAIPPDREVAWGNEFREGREGRYKPLYLLRQKAEISGAKISTATALPDQDHPGNYEVSLKFTSQGSRTFYRLTRKNIGRQLAIVLDDRVNSAPTIQSAIPGTASITGGFTIEQARDLSIVLRAGRLPAPLRVVEERTVGPSLGADSIRMGVSASLWGAGLVAIFMLIYYRMSGMLANIALALNILLLNAIMVAFGATMTLPGIAGIALSAGFGIDGNVLILERIREELRAGKSVRAAIAKGYDRATITITDSNITTLLGAVTLLYYGTASIKGFALTLTIGLFLNLFTSILVTRVLYDFITSRWKLERLSI